MRDARPFLLIIFSALAMEAAAQNPVETPPAVPENQGAAAIVAPAQAAPARIRVPEGTEVSLVFADALSSATNAEGDRFNLRVDGDVKVGGKVVIKSGSIAVGTVTHAQRRGYMGKPGELNVMLDHVTVGDERIRLRASKGKTGDAKVGATVALTALFGPIGLLKRGHDTEIKSGTPITAFVDETTEVVPAP